MNKRASQRKDSDNSSQANAVSPQTAVSQREEGSSGSASNKKDYFFGQEVGNGVPSSSSINGATPPNILNLSQASGVSSIYNSIPKVPFTGADDVKILGGSWKWQTSQVNEMLRGIFNKKNFSKENPLVQRVIYFNKEKPAPKQTLTKADFADYRKSIRRLVEEIERIQNIQMRRHQLIASLDISASLEACRQHVPEKYFKRDFKFEEIIKNFSRKNANNIQIEVNQRNKLELLNLPH